MFALISLVLRLVFPLALGGCALVSGGTALPVTVDDRELIRSAQQFASFHVPIITHELNDRPVKVFKVAFDGTLNDRLRVPPTEVETVVAAISSRIGAVYFPGPGMQDPKFVNWADAALGYSSSTIAQNAKEALFSEAAQWIRANRNVEVRVFVTGFSRGAAIARHFMNLVARDWEEKIGREAAPPRFYAVLFDTVSTGQTETLDLFLPDSLDYLVHFVAKDEPRILFAPIIDKEVHANPGSITRTYRLDGFEPPQRINLIQLPGSHSDVGSAYNGGVGLLYRQLSEQLLSQMGLIKQSCWEAPDEIYSSGKHDSRGVIDRLTGAPAPNSSTSKSRKFQTVFSSAPGLHRSAEIANRLSMMSLASYSGRPGIARMWNERLYPSFEIVRSGAEIKILEYEPSNYIDGTSFEFSHRDGQRRLTYRFVAPYASKVSTILLTDPIWRLLPEGRVARVSYSAVRRGERTYLATHVDNVLATFVAIDEAQSDHVAAGERHCAMDTDGNMVSPLKMMVIKPGIR